MARGCGGAEWGGRRGGGEGGGGGGGGPIVHPQEGKLRQTGTTAFRRADMGLPSLLVQRASDFILILVSYKLNLLIWRGGGGKTGRPKKKS